jgi:hypothetical protein
LFFVNLFRADVDHNERLSKDELTNYAFKNVQQHVKEAKDRNSQLFILIDTNQNGKSFYSIGLSA